MRQREEFGWPVRVYWEDTDTGVLGVWTYYKRVSKVWT